MRVIELARTPLRPSVVEIRAAVAAIFNDDVDENTDLSANIAVVALAYKLLLDVGVDGYHITRIFRFFRQALLGWEYPRPLLLSINDNRHAVLVGPHDSGGYDYKARVAVDATKLPAPLLQASVNLAGLYELTE